MLARLHRRETNRRVHVVGHSGVDRVNPVPLLCQKLAPIPIDPGVGHFLVCLGQMVGIHIADGDHIGARMLLEVLKIIESHHAAHADAGVLEASVEIGGPKDVGGKANPCQGGELLNELTAGCFHGCVRF